MSRVKNVEVRRTALDEGKERWIQAVRWRRTVEQALREVGLTFPQWLLLDATAQLIEETEDAVSQGEAAERAELDKMTASQIMRTLETRGWVDRGPSMSGRAYRIILTKRGEKIVRAGRECAEEASRKPRAKP